MQAQVTNIPVAPAHPAGQGTSVKGGHYLAYKAQVNFPVEATLELLNSSNPWRSGPGFDFYVKVLAQAPATVQAAIDLGKEHGFKAQQVQNHLKWLYTWVGYLKVGGAQYAPPATPEIPAPAPKTPRKAKKSKASE
jgi:hypothetical protein